jgi:hypothetical protein
MFRSTSARSCCHIVPGRLRLKLRALKHSPDRAEQLAATARQVSGVTNATANPRTGSLLVLFDPARTGCALILDHTRDRGEIDIDPCAGPVRASHPGRDDRPLAGIVGLVCSTVGTELLKLILCQALEETPWAALVAVM